MAAASRLRISIYEGVLLKLVHTLMRAVGSILSYLWEGWGAVVGLALFGALWQFGANHYGPFILPSPGVAITHIATFFEQDGLFPAARATAARALSGFCLAAFIGTCLGIAVGLSRVAMLILQPIVTFLMGVPPIAWIVLALLWFGTQGAPAFTVLITAAPIVFAGAAEGTRTRSHDLEDMALSFGCGWWRMLIEVHLPHVVSYLFPALITALAMSWKVAVMAELLAGSYGVGDEIARARSNLETGAAMGWILVVVAMLFSIEYLLLTPIKRHIETWRGPTAGSHPHKRLRQGAPGD